MLQEILDPKTKAEKVQTLFIFSCGAIALISSTFIPFTLNYLLLSGAIYYLGISLPFWESLHQAEPSPFAEVEPSQKMMILGTITCFGLYLGQAYLLSQIAILTITAGLSAAFFIHQCVLGSQRKLNQALQAAVINGDVAMAEILLQRGADLFAQNEQGDNCLHLTVQHFHSSILIESFIQKIQNRHKISLKEVLTSNQIFFDKKMRTLFMALWPALNTAVKDFSRENQKALYQAGFKFIRAFLQKLNQSLDFLTEYLRQKAANRKDINAKNLQGLTPLDLVYHYQLKDRGFVEDLLKLGATVPAESVVPTTLDQENVGSAINDTIKNTNDHDTTLPHKTFSDNTFRPG